MRKLAPFQFCLCVRRTLVDKVVMVLVSVCPSYPFILAVPMNVRTRFLMIRSDAGMFVVCNPPVQVTFLL